jgi:hypothetical protein
MSNCPLGATTCLIDEEAERSFQGDESDFAELAVFAGSIWALREGVEVIPLGPNEQFRVKKGGVVSYWDGSRLWIYGSVEQISEGLVVG